jgi:hypothetical protein
LIFLQILVKVDLSLQKQLQEPEEIQERNPLVWEKERERRILGRYFERRTIMGYLEHFRLNMRVAFRCLIMAFFHGLHAVLPFEITSHEYWNK